MFWSFYELEPERRTRLAAISTGREPPPAGAYFESLDRPRLLALVGFGSFVVALALALTAHWLSLQGWFVWHPYLLDGIWAAAALSAGYGLVCLAARVRTARSGIRPFVLVTPAGIIKVGRSHGGVLGFRLQEATKFNLVDTYSTWQRYSGRAYRFTFPGDNLEHKIRSAARQQELEQVLAAAKAGGAKAGEPLLPSGRGQPRLPVRCLILDPFSPAWIQTWVALGAAACLVYIIFGGF